MARRPRYRLIGGLRMPLGFPPAALESAAAFAPAPGDVFVCSYPKCGTTWLQYIVYLLVRRRRLNPDQALGDVFPHVEEVGTEPIEALPAPRLIKTHLFFNATPMTSEARYLVIARNPFDCCVSFFHHTRGFPVHYDFVAGTFADYFECFVRGEVDFGDYFEYWRSWQAALDRPNVCFLTYEMLKSDVRAEIRRVAGFLGPAVLDYAADERVLDELIEESSLASMQRDQARWSSRRADGMPPFVREGAVGGWKSLFTPEQAARLLAKFDRCFGATPFGTLWPDVIADARAYAAGASAQQQ
ncbi:MAG: sulfotransferase domain-containing protein [Gammaproteobacteria bacterium]|nr:sulfotransferase domain-containing protein [Gammaproteobacteria bacterium]